jgi:hypothetical protein
VHEEKQGDRQVGDPVENDGAHAMGGRKRGSENNRGKNNGAVIEETAQAIHFYDGNNDIAFTLSYIAFSD